MLRRKRVYSDFTPSDGYRVLVDRLWPRGLSKERAHVDLWMKEIGPSDQLRKWFGHDPERWSAFQERYWKELQDQPELIGQLNQVLKEHRCVTLLFGAKDEEHNQAVALQDFLQKRGRPARRAASA